MSNAYQALYRKWRPRTFSDVCGQDTVTTALKNELKTGRLSHAYLFTGCRGTGKTTCAKILAKAVNCLSPIEGDPCGQCALCRGIDDGSVLDVTEIDAASNNGVDNIRQLREEVSFTPVNGQYRVYIIDEVHMLSPGAFNALLKTLEEPPAHVIFVLATTEVHKLPATILSRCQRFDFNRIPPEIIAARLAYVAKQEGISLQEDAALLLARLADGALRDGLSLLDQCAATTATVDTATVAAVTGMAGQAVLEQLTLAIANQDAAGALAQVDRLYQSSKDMERLCAEWIGYVRNLMVVHSVKTPGSLVVATPQDLSEMKQTAARLGLPRILHLLEALQDAHARLRSGGDRRVEMEMAVLRLCDPRLDGGEAALLNRIAALEQALADGAPRTPTAPAPVETLSASAPATSPEPAPTPAEPAAAPAEELPPPPAAPDEPPAEPAAAAECDPPAGEQPFPAWDEVLACLKTSCPPLHGVLADSSALLEDDWLVICTNNDLFSTLLKTGNNKDRLADALRTVTGRTYRARLRRKTLVSKTEANDPLSKLIAAGRDAGVTVNETE